MTRLQLTNSSPTAPPPAAPSVPLAARRLTAVPQDIALARDVAHGAAMRAVAELIAANRALVARIEALEAKVERRAREVTAMGQRLARLEHRLCIAPPPAADLPAITSIMADVAHAHGLTEDHLRGPGRWRRVVRARDEAIYLCRIEGWSAPVIGRQFGGRDHSTILEAARRHALRLGLSVAGEGAP